MTDTSHFRRKPRLLKGFDRSLARIKRVLSSRYGEEQANTLIGESRGEYEALIPQIPHIGEKSPFLIFLLPTVRCLAVYRALQRRGGTVEEAGELIYEMSEAEFQAIPGLARRAIGHLWFSSWFLRRLRKRARTSQERQYPDSFVVHYVEGYGQDFDYGIDYVECANVKFLRAQGALELAPYICATDKAASEMLGWGLHRTMTLAGGSAKCDFRFTKGGTTSVQESRTPQHVRE